MSGECSVPDGPDDDLKDMSDYSEEDLWQLINDNRHRISLSVRPCRLMPYLRQARVLTEVDEDEILSSHNLTNRTMRTSYMLDLLGTQGRNGAVALLEGLMIHYPTIYTQVTGRTPSTEPSRFSGLIKYSELTEYLIRAVTGMQKELQEARNEAGRHGARAASLESELGQLVEQEKESRDLQSDYERMRKHLAAAHRDVTKLKDEKCDVYVRYTAAIEEKSAVNIRNRDLSLQVYQLQTELQKAQTETDFQKRRSLRCASPAETQQLREEVSALRRQLLEAEKFSPAREDILAQDLAEAMDGRMELAEQLKCYREENEQLLREKEEILEQKERVSLQVEQLTLDCNMYKQKSTVIQAQMRELQAERDHAYVSRDEAQAQIARSLAEKDTLRAHLVELQERIFTLRSQQGTRRERRDTSGGRVVSWESSSSEDSPCTAAAPRLRLRRMPAINPASCDDAAPERIDSFHSYNAEPPCTQSLRRRDETLYEDSSLEMTDTESLLDDYVFLPDDNCKGLQRSKAYKALQRTASTNGSTKSICRTSPPPFLVRSRPRAIRASGRVLTISFQADTLLSQLTVVGGNKTGVFVHEVMEGSAAQGIGIRPGSQIVQVKCEQNQQSLSMVLVDSTLEEAMWALDQVRGFCHISLRPSQDAYETLLQQLQSTPTNSGDSFYVRVNVALPSGPGGTLAVCCNDILHVTNTQPAGTEDSWRASHVYPCQLLDLQSGTVPNYYRAQRLLIRAIEDMSFQLKMGHKTPEKQKAVRIVSTGRQGRNPLWMSVENCQTTSTEPGDASAPRGCVTLMPYTLVTPHFPPVCRPILLLPTTLGRILDKKMAEWQGFKLCEPEVLTPTEHAARLQRSEVLEECEQDGNQSYTLQSVEKVMKQGIHCVLPLGLDCVRRLHRAEIFPIIIFIAQTARSARKLRSKLLHRSGRTEEQLLACSQSEEPLLDKLPCLYRHVAPDSWCDTTALMTSLRTIIWEEQKKIVWVEPDLW